MCRAAQPLAAIAASRYALGAEGVGAARPGACGSLFAASRYALGAEGVGAARPGACGSLFAASRYALGAEGVGAARPGAYMFPPPLTARVASWWWGRPRRRALRAARDARCNARFALLPRARVGRGGPDIIKVLSYRRGFSLAPARIR